MNIFSLFIFLVVSSWSWLLHLQVTRANGSFVTPLMSHERTETISIGAIFDETSRPGKEAKVAMEMVIHDFNAVSDQHLHLHFRNSRGKPVGAALSGNFFIELDLSRSYNIFNNFDLSVITRNHGITVTISICMAPRTHCN